MRNSDRRVKYTKMVLRESLLELLQEKPIGRISVTELCQKADVNRGTFYAHYSEPGDLLKSIEEELFEELKESFTMFADKSLEEANVELMNIISRNIELCRVILSQNASCCYMNRLHDMSTEFFKARWKCKIEKLNLPVDYLYHFIATGNIEIIRMWIMNDEGRTPREVANIMTELSRSIMHACNHDECCK